MFNFENIGGKIKTLAVVLTILGVVASIMICVFLLFRNFLIGILIAIIGSLVSWISSFFMYGFGELIEKTTEVAKNTKQDIQVKIVEEKNK